MSASFFQRADEVGQSRPVGFFGSSIGTGKFGSGNNQRPQAYMVVTSAIPASPDSSTVYSVVIGGVTCSYTTDASATQAELGAGLVAAIQVQPGARAVMAPSYAGGTLTLTAAWPGETIVVSTSGGSGGGAIGAATTATAAASASVIYLGRVICTDGNVTNEGARKVFMPTTALFSAQVTTFTYASVAANDIISTTVEMNGQSTTVVTPYNTSHAQTLTDHTADLEVRLNALFGAGVGCVAANSTNDITITADVAGAEFYASSTIGGTGGGTVTKADTTGPSIATSVRRSLTGISSWRADVPNVTVGGDDPAYPANGAVQYKRVGEVLVQRDTTETWDRNSDTWVSVSATASLSGRLYDTSSSTRVWLPRDLIRITGQEPSTQSNGVGIVDTNIGA